MTTQSDRTPPGQHFAVLDGARALMAFWVVIGHSLQQAGLDKGLVWPVSVLRNPALPVYVFMMISGFVISHLIKTSKEPYLAYIIRRFFRLAPLLLCAVIFIIVWSYFDNKTFHWEKSFVLEYLAAYATLTQGLIPWEILPRASVAILSPAWSISLEWQFYLVAPFLVMAPIRFRYWIFAIAALISVCITPQTINHSTGLTLTEAFLPVTLYYFIIGIISYDAVSAVRGKIRISDSAIVALSILVFCISGNYVITIWVLIFFGLIGYNFVSAALSSELLRWFGKISFSIYLVHMIVITIVRKVLGHNFLGIGFNSWSLFWLIIFVGIPSTVAISSLTYRVVELPGMRLGRWLARRLTDAETRSASDGAQEERTLPTAP